MVTTTDATRRVRPSSWTLHSNRPLISRPAPADRSQRALPRTLRALARSLRALAGTLRDIAARLERGAAEQRMSAWHEANRPGG